MAVKKTILILGAGIAAVSLFFFISDRFGDKRPEDGISPHFILDKNFRSDASDSILPGGARLPDGTPTDSALTFFQATANRFAEQSLDNLDSHFARVKEYFDSVFNSSDARRLYELYRNYLNTEITIANEKEFRATSAAPREILALLHKIQDYRRKRLGKEMADVLFGQEVKRREYLLRQSLILDDPQLYGREKEDRLLALQQSMWGTEAIPPVQGSSDYDRYQRKLKIYHKDLSEMGEAQRKLKIDAFRRAFFDNETLERLTAVDRQISAEKEKVEQYRQYEQQIIHDATIAPAERSKRLKALQDKLFGDEADAFRRRETIYGDAASQREQQP